MKLLTQGDDFGFTRGVTYGIVDAIDRGILRNTGMFTNMPSSELAASFVKDRPHVCFGIDFNIVSGPSVSDPKEIPHLTDEKGMFIRSTVRTKDPRFKTEEGRRALFPYAEVYKEIRVQYDRFVELVGQKPGYLHGHSLNHEHYDEAIRQVSKETGVPYVDEAAFRDHFHMGSKREIEKENSEMNKGKEDVFSVANQLNGKPADDFLNNLDYYLSCDYAILIGHPGYVDNELFDLTTCNIIRSKDAAMFMDERVIKAIKDNNIELVTYYDLYKEL